MTISYQPYKSDILSNVAQIRCLLIVVAMESEEKSLIEDLEYEEISLGKNSSLTIKKIQLPTCDILIGRSGVGLVNAGILFTLVTEKYNVDAIIQTGVGGALNKSLNIGDIVVSKKIIQHDSIASDDKNNHLMAAGELFHSTPNNQQIDPVLRSDTTLKNWITSALSETFPGKVYEGTILSGSEFVGSKRKKECIATLDKEAMLVDMESAALAQLSRKASIAFISVKVVADKASPDTSIVTEYKTFLSAANTSTQLIMKSLQLTFNR
ncbi:MAG: 5'-methylthioadenosine/S-adenosylhomocysteine nucleosidase [Alphaproteobacteria bacterium]|nr:5'-methylthioadenosine/S-adenosylhomocysteine nucleosidase [Alphaproteobacteria bacterium]